MSKRVRRGMVPFRSLFIDQVGFLSRGICAATRREYGSIEARWSVPEVFLRRVIPANRPRCCRVRVDHIGGETEIRPVSFSKQAPRAIPGKVRSGFPSGIASKQRDRVVRRFRETMKRSKPGAKSVPPLAIPACPDLPLPQARRMHGSRKSKSGSVRSAQGWPEAFRRPPGYRS